MEKRLDRYTPIGNTVIIMAKGKPRLESKDELMGFLCIEHFLNDF